MAAGSNEEKAAGWRIAEWVTPGFAIMQECGQNEYW